MSKELRFLQITITNIRIVHFFPVFLAINTSSQNILMTLLQISLKLGGEKAPVNDFGIKVASDEKYCCK